MPAGRTTFVGIDGLGGSGKSTLATATAGAVPRAVVTPTDDFQGPGVPEWDWARAAGALVLIEGVAAIRSELAVPWDLTIWVDAPRRARRTRIERRDGPAELRLWRESWWPSEDAYVPS